MSKTTTRIILLLLIIFTKALAVKAQATASNVTQAQADKWFESHQYLNGLKLVPAESTNRIEFYKQYMANKKVWDEAFAYLKNTDLDKLLPGKYPIDGENVYASVTDNPTKPYESTAWESHRKYVDLQYVIQGAEKIAVAPVATAKITKVYDEKRDGAGYDTEGKLYEAKPGTFYLFFPPDAHRPNIKADGYEHDKKIVLKIRVID
jgi:biofilm protein TabA